MMQGAKNLAVVMPGDGKGSRIYEVIESGDMPRGGGKVDMAELTTLTKWIDQGAKFDGKDPTQTLEGPRRAGRNTQHGAGAEARSHGRQRARNRSASRATSPR